VILLSLMMTTMTFPLMTLMFYNPKGD